MEYAIKPWMNNKNSICLQHLLTTNVDAQWIWLLLSIALSVQLLIYLIYFFVKNDFCTKEEKRIQHDINKNTRTKGWNENVE